MKNRRTWFDRGWRFGRDSLALLLATLLFWAPAVAPLASAQDDDPRGPTPSPHTEAPLHGVELTDAELRGDRGVAEGIAETTPIDRAAVTEEISEALEERTDAPVEATPISLPGGETRSAVSSQAISLPSAEGSIEGMGESFAPVLSSGTATFSVPIAVAPGRAGVQPSLSLAYSSSGGNGAIGFGWGMGVPFISRQTDRGLPRYVDQAHWHAEEDRFIYNGGQELVPVRSDEIARIDQQAAATGDASELPADIAGWQQYRARVEGGFMRFFRGPPDSSGRVSSWVVQSKDGTRFDFGLLPSFEGGPADSSSGNSLEVDSGETGPRAGTRVFRWMLTRMSDAHGSTVYYRYRRDQGQLYLDDIFYLSPASCGRLDPTIARRCSAPLESYGARVHVDYETRQDAFSSYSSGWPVTTALRATQIEVSAYEDSTGRRTRVRRYHLRYQADAYHSLLESVQVEGRPHAMRADVGVEVGDPTVPEGSDAPGAFLPPMTFSYSALPDVAGAIAGFGGLSGSVHSIDSSPPHSIDEARSDFFDVNSDGLPDLIVTDPARYRTPDGDPAVGVFFNGFTGPDATPATAGEFSDAVPMAMRSDLSGVLSLSNLNIVPMDIDGDGRSDLLHMPRIRSYGWFTPTREADPTDAPAHVSPADQGWRWTYATIDLPASDLDPRIDFGRDSQFIQVVDVNNDHLVDVVRTSGTVMQTWLNLGWVPLRDSSGRNAGDGRFGHATWSGSAWTLSTEPIESCLLQAGTALDFEDPESRLSDMNGDGLVDLVRIRQGRVIWWPGRGTGSFGVGPHDCPRGAGAERYIEMGTPPAEINVDLAGVQLADVDGDGASDVVQVRFGDVDVWFNRAGQSFTQRFTVRSTPAAPDFAPRTRLMDIDGSGTLDLVYANGDRWQYVDLLEHTQPRMLVSVDNGLGALTTIDYDTSARDYLEDLASATSDCRDESTGCDRFAWSRVEGSPSRRLAQRAPSEDPSGMFHGAGTPVISTVVRRISTSDRFAVYSADQVSETQFAYHEGYYEGIEQEFRGFGAADSMTVGDETNPSVLTRTWFHQGRRSQLIADDRLAWNPDEALKGREYLTEVFDESARYLSSAHATMTSRTLFTGQDGRPIQYAFVSQANEIRYDTTPFTAQLATIELPDVLTETVNSTTGAPSAPVVERTRSVRVRGARAVVVRTTYDVVDNLGQVHQQTAHGHLDYTTVPGAISLPVDPVITSVTEPVLLAGANWIWRTARSYLLDEGGGHLRESTTRFNPATGDLLRSTQAVITPRAYTFAGDPMGQGTAETLAQDTGTDGDLIASSIVDEWGQAVASCIGVDIGEASLADPSTMTPPAFCFRFATVARETQFDQLATSETAFVARSGPLSTLTTLGAWDRGLGVLTAATDPNDLDTSVTYDGLGRMTSVTPPAADGCSSARPTTRIQYELTSSPASQPVSRVISTTQLACTGSLDSNTLRSIGYVDGLGRVRATLATAGAEEGAWVRGGLARLDRKGAVREAWQSDFFDGAETSFASVLATPSESFPHTRSVYDAFGRVRVAYAEDGSLTSTSFHALSTDVCDPLDNDPSSMHFHTCTTARTDGHGRLIDQVLRNRQPGSSVTEYHRLWTYYRNDGAVLTLVRAQENAETVRPERAAALGGTFPHVHRDFIYDSVGRRIGSDDPDTDDRTPGAPASSRTWRYLFSRAGDLTAVRDPRGCGQNFYYDLGGRLLGEQYVGCSTASHEYQPSEDPSAVDEDNEIVNAVGMTANTMGSRVVDVRYFYDEEPSWVASATIDSASPQPIGAPLRGRATGVIDRAQRAAVSYDDRGNAIWTARQVAVIAAAPSIDTSSLGSGALPTFTEPTVSASTVLYDEAHTYVRTAQFDHAGRPTSMALPRDPDWDEDGLTNAPLVQGKLTYNARGLPATAELIVGDDDPIHVVRAIHYLRDGLVDLIQYGNQAPSVGESETVVASTTQYDERRRPTRLQSVRPATGSTGLRAVTAIADQVLVWDAASNLTALLDQRDASDWPAGNRPQSVEIQHDSLYRVVGALFNYTEPGDGAPGSPFESVGTDDATDWRDTAAASNSVDPMRPEPAAMVTTSAPQRVQGLTWEWDWLGNMQEWTDDAQQFYERSIGDIQNGYEVGGRPSALYLASNMADVGAGGEGGFVQLGYGVGGNVTSVTVHGQCVATTACVADLSVCSCAVVQHYQYQWDELNRIGEARRFDQTGGGTWTFEARQRYRYDGANVRVVKESFDTTAGDSRVASYVYPGDFERRGLVSNGTTYERFVGAGGNPVQTETEYVVAGARMVWQHDAIAPGVGETSTLDRNRRVTVGVGDLLQTTAASVDLMSGELLEVSTYYPIGARETLLVDDELEPVPLEPMGFTGKEADEDVGLVYFGERYLLARMARWASPDPIWVHAAGGGESLNSYHYVGGGMLDRFDPAGLEMHVVPPVATQRIADENDIAVREGAVTVDRDGAMDAGWRMFTDQFSEEQATLFNFDSSTGEISLVRGWEGRARELVERGQFDFSVATAVLAITDTGDHWIVPVQILSADDTQFPGTGLFRVTLVTSEASVGGSREQSYQVAAGDYSPAGYVGGQTYLPLDEIRESASISGERVRYDWDSRYEHTSISFVTTFRADDQALWDPAQDRVHVAMREGAMRASQAGDLRHEIYRHALRASLHLGSVWHEGSAGPTRSPADDAFIEQIMQRLRADSCAGAHKDCGL